MSGSSKFSTNDLRPSLKFIVWAFSFACSFIVSKSIPCNDLKYAKTDGYALNNLKNNNNNLTFV